MSTSRRPRPWAADVGNAWWLLCQASPNVISDSQARLRDSSSVWNRLRPKKWQSELIENVAWCRTSRRTAPPQSTPVRALVRLPPISQPRRNGAMKPASAQPMNVRSTNATTGSLSRSGA